ncbi:hypothetical protein Tco_1453333 [Tanacetum coccineum]
MFYPRFTKVIINHFMSQDQSIPRRNKVDWHMANDDPILTTIRFIPQHKVVQRYGAILPDYLTNPALKESLATETDEASKPSSNKRVKATAKVAKSRKKKHPALGLETLSEVALTEAEQLKLATKRSLIQTHSSHASGSGAHEGTGVTPGVPDGKDKDDDDEQTESDNDDEDFVHSKFTTHNDEARQEEGEEESCDPRVQTHSHVESTDDDDDDDEVQGVNIEEDTFVIITPVIPEGQQQSSSMSSGFISNMLNPRPDSGIDLIFTLNTKATSLVDVPVTTIAECWIVY